MAVSPANTSPRYPAPGTVLELLKPVTWFPPMWAYACGVVSSGMPILEAWEMALLGVILSGPIVCAMSQAANDWCDRHVDAINEPLRPIPSGRMPGRWGLYVALAWTVLSLVVGALLGPWGFGATLFAIICAWAYSAEPVRLKRNGWIGPGVVGLCYEGLPWFTGAVVMAGAAGARLEVILVAGLYAIGAHGIMTLNDFKAIEGDTRQGLNSLPVLLGPEKAARLACWIMGVPQLIVLGLLIFWGAVWSACVVSVVLLAQIWAMRRMLKDPKGLAPWYNGTGVLLYVSGMMASALALGGMV